MKRKTLDVIFRAIDVPWYENSNNRSSVEVTAVFPAVPYSNDMHAVQCYAHTGQHSACTQDWYFKTRAASPEEFASLWRELQAIYQSGEGAVTLRLRKRWTKHHDHARRLALQE